MSNAPHLVMVENRRQRRRMDANGAVLALLNVKVGLRATSQPRASSHTCMARHGLRTFARAAWRGVPSPTYIRWPRGERRRPEDG
eukprot:3204436-Pleurochrysis_carterae.AAC.1